MSEILWCVVKKTEVLNEELRLPRPKITKCILLVASKVECEDVCNELAKSPRNQSTEDIEVTVYVERYHGQKANTSARPGNGTR